METVVEIAEFLARTTLFSNLPPAARTGLAAVMRRRDLQKGDVLFEAGAPGDGAFVVRAGLIQIVDRGTGQLLNEIARGGQLGEMAVLSGEPRAARAVAAVDSVLYEIEASTLRELFERQPELHARLSLDLIRMLQKRVRRPGGARLTGLLAPPERGPQCREIACAVARELKTAANESVVVLDAYAGPASDRGAARAVGEDVGDMTQFVRRLLGPETIVDEGGIPVLRLASGGEEGRIGGLLAELQSRFDRVIVVAAYPFGSGAGSAIAQCERLYALGTQGPAVGGNWVAQVENELRREMASPPVFQPLRAEQSSGRELRSLAREIGGRRRALVLGAGGAKGMAHVGALAAFERAGIEFDEIGGSSAGAVVAALHASGWSATDAGAMLTEVAANPWKTLLDVGIPKESVYLSRKKTELFEHYAAGRRIEDLPLPFFAVAGDLRSLAPVVFRNGPIAVALDATTAIPAIFRPVELGDALLVDGWVCNPLPADVARQAGHEQVVAIDLSSPDPSLQKGGRMLGAPTPEGRFQMLAIALRAMELGSQEHVMRNLPLIDILVRPDVSEFTASDFAAASVMRDRGEAAGEAAVAAIRGLAAARRP